MLLYFNIKYGVVTTNNEPVRNHVNAPVLRIWRYWFWDFFLHSLYILVISERFIHVDNVWVNKTLITLKEANIKRILMLKFYYKPLYHVDCTSDEFQCPVTGECINGAFICDSIIDCDSGADEIGCCDAQEFTCTNNRCVSLSLVCDGFDNCRDNSDELNCRMFVLLCFFLCVIHIWFFSFKYFAIFLTT